MYILVTYDVDTTSKEGARRLRCVAKACLDYGQRVQNSVFECVVTEAQYSLLKGRVRDIIDMLIIHPESAYTAASRSSQQL